MRDGVYANTAYGGATALDVKTDTTVVCRETPTCASISDHYRASATSTVEDSRWRVGSDGATRVLSSSLSTMARVRCVRTQVAHPPEEPRYTVVGEAPDDAVTDRGTGLSWQRRPSRTTYTFAEAADYCAGLALVGGGFRVPSMKELQTVLDEQAPSYIDADVFPDYPATQNPTFWTSTLSARGPENAWFVRGGWTLNVAVDAGVDAKFYVRCVK